MRRHRTAIVVTALVLGVVAMRHPSADIQILTHQAADSSPYRIKAAVDLGIMGFSLLITWTGHRLGGG
ncbi:MAG: hypothetical protein ACKVOB_10955 [Sphingomonas sp.]